MTKFLTSSLSLVCLLVAGISSASAQTVNRKLVEVGNKTAFTYEQSLSRHFILRYSGGLSLNQALDPVHESGLHYEPAPEQPYPDLGTMMQEIHDPDQFHFISRHYGVSPFLSIAARWYPHPLEANSGFYMQLEGEFIPTQWSFIKQGDYDEGMKSVIAFPLSMGYNFHVTDALDIRIAGKVITGTTKLNDAWEGIFTTGMDFAVAYSF